MVIRLSFVQGQVDFDENLIIKEELVWFSVNRFYIESGIEHRHPSVHLHVGRGPLPTDTIGQKISK